MHIAYNESNLYKKKTYRLWKSIDFNHNWYVYWRLLQTSYFTTFHSLKEIIITPPVNNLLVFIY